MARGRKSAGGTLPVLLADDKTLLVEAHRGVLIAQTRATIAQQAVTTKQQEMQKLFLQIAERRRIDVTQWSLNLETWEFFPANTQPAAPKPSE